MGQNITNTSVSEYEEFQMEEIVPDFILVTTYFTLGSAGNIAIIWLYSNMNQPRTKAYKEIIVFLAIVDLISCILNSFFKYSFANRTSFPRKFLFLQVFTIFLSCDHCIFCIYLACDCIAEVSINLQAV